MEMVRAKVLANEALSDTVMKMTLNSASIAEKALPGQFVNVRVSEHTAPLLRRPFGVAGARAASGEFDIIYRVIGEGTQTLKGAALGADLSIVGPLGQGFDIGGKKTLIVGGGLGLAPLLFLAQARPDADVLMGARNASELFWEKLFSKYCGNIFVTTDDGSYGTKGNVLALLPSILGKTKYDLVCVCGPVPMMKAVAACCADHGAPCQVSLEKYMACGLGACLSCSFDGLSGRRKVCKDGPVFYSTEILSW